MIAKNLVIEYTTTATSTPLSSRVWTPVTGLSNGFQGAERLTATSVNSNGTVVGDSHDSLASGWASLTFNPVNATGIRIGFSNATPSRLIITAFTNSKFTREEPEPEQVARDPSQ